jgi:hypothetical protein
MTSIAYSRNGERDEFGRTHAGVAPAVIEDQRMPAAGPGDEPEIPAFEGDACCLDGHGDLL